MTSSKLGLLGVCAVVLGMMAMFASSAQAALSWLVLNAKETVATEVKLEGGVVNLLAVVEGESDTANVTLLTRLVGVTVGVVCTSFSTSNLNLEPEGKFSTGYKFIFTGCKVTENGAKTNCTVKTSGAAAGTVETTNLKGQLFLHEISPTEKEVLIKVEPEGTGFGTVRFEGECNLPEINVLKGILYLKETAPTTFGLRFLLSQGPLTSLFLGEDTAEHLMTSIDGSVFLKLGGAHVGLKWAAMDM